MHKICAHQQVYTVSIPPLPSTEGNKLQKVTTEFKHEKAIKIHYAPSSKPHYRFPSLMKNIVL